MKFQTLFSASNALSKWLKLDFPRLPVGEGQRVGVVPLLTNSEMISWQCHVMFTDSWRERATVIAVEAHSRFTLLIPFDVVPSQDKLEQVICEQWANELVGLAIKHGELDRDAIPRVFTQFYERVKEVTWVRNMDMSVQGHVSDAEQWVRDTLAGRGLDALDDELAQDIAWHINSLQKRAKDKLGNKRTLYPVPLFVEDGLFHFASPLSRHHDFNNPYEIQT
ncbi:MAG TPA: hypothetical protein ENH74_01085, partial [Methylophaga sp.]|nr:hypothetical protein [Methylophaga sp.]